jgi:hypothetical protein
MYNLNFICTCAALDTANLRYLSIYLRGNKLGQDSRVHMVSIYEKTSNRKSHANIPLNLMVTNKNCLKL